MQDQAQTLYDAGWRQGSRIAANLPCDYIGLDGGNIVRIQLEHDEWILVTQDCDLNSTSVNAGSFVELRPIFSEPDYVRLGIRSSKFAVAEGKVLSAQSTRIMLEARALATLLESRQAPIGAKRRRYLKTWLGLRYDRPAVPTEFAPLAKAVAEAVRRLRDRDIDRLVRCVLMDLRNQDGPIANLYAVIYDVANREIVEEWLERVAARVNAGRVLDRQALTEGQISLQALENTYPADLSQITVDAEMDELDRHVD